MKIHEYSKSILTILALLFGLFGSASLQARMDQYFFSALYDEGKLSRRQLWSLWKSLDHEDKRDTFGILYSEFSLDDEFRGIILKAWKKLDLQGKYKNFKLFAGLGKYADELWAAWKRFSPQEKISMFSTLCYSAFGSYNSEGNFENFGNVDNILKAWKKLSGKGRVDTFALLCENVTDPDKLLEAWGILMKKKKMDHQQRLSLFRQLCGATVSHRDDVLDVLVREWKALDEKERRDNLRYLSNVSESAAREACEDIGDKYVSDDED